MGHQPAQQAGVVGRTSRRHRLTRLLAAMLKASAICSRRTESAPFEIGRVRATRSVRCQVRARSQRHDPGVLIDP
jgi:hypothetical protein